MKTRRTSRPFGLRRRLSVYHLVGAALPLALNGCSSDDRAPLTLQPSPSLPAPDAPALSVSPEMPAAEGSTTAPTMAT
ncbi:MAG: hypothetical protein ABI895_03690, partial [Deltaproteobacteria bacterium]